MPRQEGPSLARGLGELEDHYPWIGEARGMGLMQALEIVQDRRTKEPAPKIAKALLEAAKEEGLLIGIGGLQGHVLPHRPVALDHRG